MKNKTCDEAILRTYLHLWSVSQAMISKQWTEQSDVTINLKPDDSYTMLSLNSLYLKYIWNVLKCTS